LQAVYAKLFNVIQFPAGNTGVQMGGWFREGRVNTVADFRVSRCASPVLAGR